MAQNTPSNRAENPSSLLQRGSIAALLALTPAYSGCDTEDCDYQEGSGIAVDVYTEDENHPVYHENSYKISPYDILIRCTGQEFKYTLPFDISKSENEKWRYGGWDPEMPAGEYTCDNYFKDNPRYRLLTEEGHELPVTIIVEDCRRTVLPLFMETQQEQ